MMSNARIKIFSFNSTKMTADQIAEIVNKFLENPDIDVETADIEFLPDEYTTISVRYTLRKSRNKNIKKCKKSNNSK